MHIRVCRMAELVTVLAAAGVERPAMDAMAARQARREVDDKSHLPPLKAPPQSPTQTDPEACQACRRLTAGQVMSAAPEWGSMLRRVASKRSQACFACFSTLATNRSIWPLYLGPAGVATLRDRQHLLQNAVPASTGILTVVLNLARSKPRMVKMRKRLARAGVHGYVRLSNLYGTMVKRTPDKKHTMLERMGLTTNEAARPRDAASALSHLLVWEFAARTNQAMLIFEDDVKFNHPNFGRFVRRLLNATRVCSKSIVAAAGCELAGDPPLDLLHLFWFRKITQPICVHTVTADRAHAALDQFGEPLRRFRHQSAFEVRQHFKGLVLPLDEDQGSAGEKQIGLPMLAPDGWDTKLTRRLKRLHCSGRGYHNDEGFVIPSVTAYVVTPQGARKALGLVWPLTRTVDVSLGRYSTQLNWYALREDKGLAVEHDTSFGSVRMNGFSAAPDEGEAESKREAHKRVPISEDGAEDISDVVEP